MVPRKIPRNAVPSKKARGKVGTFGCGSKPMVPFWWVGAPPILVCFSGDSDVHWGYGILTHGHFANEESKRSDTGPVGKTRPALLGVSDRPDVFLLLGVAQVADVHAE